MMEDGRCLMEDGKKESVITLRLNKNNEVQLIKFKPPETIDISTDGKKLVKPEAQFKFYGFCPYCKGDLIYCCEGWEEDDNGMYMADMLTPDCSSEPDFEKCEDDWNEWLKVHSDMPYVHQLPVDETVKDFINKYYRFLL